MVAITAMRKRQKRPPCTFSQNIARVIATIFLLWCASFSVEAQVESGKIVGTVKDASEAVVANAAVKVTEIHTNIETKTKTDGNGEYLATELKSGEYTVTVEHRGSRKRCKPPSSWT